MLDDQFPNPAPLAAALRDYSLGTIWWVKTKTGLLHACFMVRLILLFLALVSPSLCRADRGNDDRASILSPENIVFQYMTEQTFTVPGFNSNTVTGYLWIPPSCPHVRGIIVLADNVPEEGLAGSPAIRMVCEEQGLAILYTNGSFRMPAVAVCPEQPPKDTSNSISKEPVVLWADKAKYHCQFLQQILDALARKSGYAEISTAPVLPIGESMSLFIVDVVMSGLPGRCIAGIWVKDNHLFHVLSGIPAMAACGTAAEWDEPKYDEFTRWIDMAVEDQKAFGDKRRALPDWPGSLLIEAGSAHFSCTEKMVQIIADYIAAAARARLPADGSATLRPVDLKSGFVAGLPTPGATPVSPKSYADCKTPEELSLPWYFTKELAQEAYDLADVNWNAKTQVPIFLDHAGNPLPFNKRGVFTLENPVMESDGISFTVQGGFLHKLPSYFVKGDSPLTHMNGEPDVEWLKGPVIPLGDHRFQLALDRTSGNANRDQSILLRVIHPGDADYRLSVNPAFLTILINKTGKPQSITFDPVADLPAGTKEITLHAISDSGLPVHFFVRAGPAVIHGNTLIFTPVPVRSQMPIAVTVVAWQWGNASIQTAPVVEQTFHLVK